VARSWRAPSYSALSLMAAPGDALLIEQVDRISCLTDDDWRKLRAELDVSKPTQSELRAQ